MHVPCNHSTLYWRQIKGKKEADIAPLILKTIIRYAEAFVSSVVLIAALFRLHVKAVVSFTTRLRESYVGQICFDSPASQPPSVISSFLYQSSAA